ncbi:MAG: ATP-binding protein [Bacteroidales bacterium]|nr:ATP-binding protein [Bacteroidales bacterium]
MIIDFTVSNFRSIKEPQTISFEATEDHHLEDYYVVEKGGYRLLKAATIIGANASGKTNILRAYSMFPGLVLQPSVNKSDKFPYTKFALDSDYANKDSSIIVNFLCNNSKYRYEIIFNNDLIVYEKLNRTPFGIHTDHLVFERNTNKKTMLSKIMLGDQYKNNQKEIDKLTTNLLHNRTVFGAFQWSNVNLPWMLEIVRWIASYCMPIISSSSNLNLKEYTSRSIDIHAITNEQVSALLQKADVGINGFTTKKVDIPVSPYYAAELINSNLVSFEMKEQLRKTSTMPDVKVKMMHNSNKGMVEFDFDEESRGTQRYYELAGILLTLINGSKIVPIDELEYSMHPDLYEHFLVTFLTNAKESQIIYTTHMREFLSDRNLYRDDSVWIAQKDKYGATEVYSIADFDKEELMQIENRYGAYRSGRLGGIPHLGDTYVEPLNSDKQ